FMSLWAGYYFSPTGDDSADYILLANNVAGGHGLSLSREAPFDPSAVRSPVYPVFLGLIFRVLGDSSTAVLLIQSLVLAIGCALLTKLAFVTFDKRIALVTALFFAANPYFGRWAGAVLTEALYLTLIIACVYSLTRALQTEKTTWFIAAGLI